MLVTNDLVFLELHKTGGTHIGRLLKEFLGGHEEGKHNRLAEKYKDRFVLGSVRNPWDWYVSLWAYGCLGKGSVHLQLIDGINFSYYWRQLTDEMGKRYPSPSEFLLSGINDHRKNRAFWAELYADSSSPELFQRWLQAILDPSHKLDIREGFGFSPISNHFGLMTYRFMKLFTSLEAELYKDKTLATIEGLRNAYNDNALVDYIIRNEKLEEDFLDALNKAGIVLSDEDKTSIKKGKNNKTNTSKRADTASYYDRKTLELVAKKEELLISQFDYTPPS